MPRGPGEPWNPRARLPSTGRLPGENGPVDPLQGPLHTPLGPPPRCAPATATARRWRRGGHRWGWRWIPLAENDAREAKQRRRLRCLAALLCPRPAILEIPRGSWVSFSFFAFSPFPSPSSPLPPLPHSVFPPGLAILPARLPLDGQRRRISHTLTLSPPLPRHHAEFVQTRARAAVPRRPTERVAAAAAAVAAASSSSDQGPRATQSPIEKVAVQTRPDQTTHVRRTTPAPEGSLPGPSERHGTPKSASHVCVQ